MEQQQWQAFKDWNSPWQLLSAADNDDDDNTVWEDKKRKWNCVEILGHKMSKRDVERLREDSIPEGQIVGDEASDRKMAQAEVLMDVASRAGEHDDDTTEEGQKKKSEERAKYLIEVHDQLNSMMEINNASEEQKKVVQKTLEGMSIACHGLGPTTLNIRKLASTLLSPPCMSGKKCPLRQNKNPITKAADLISIEVEEGEERTNVGYPSNKPAMRWRYCCRQCYFAFTKTEDTCSKTEWENLRKEQSAKMKTGVLEKQADKNAKDLKQAFKRMWTHQNKTIRDLLKSKDPAYKDFQDAVNRHNQDGSDTPTATSFLNGMAHAAEAEEKFDGIKIGGQLFDDLLETYRFHISAQHRAKITMRTTTGCQSFGNLQKW